MLKNIFWGLLIIFASIFLVKGVLTIQRLDVKAEFTKNSFDDVEEDILTLINSYIRSVQILASSRDFSGFVISRNKVGMETRIDDLVSKIEGSELVLVSDKAGNIIASNTKNGRVKSFNNSNIVDKPISLAAWFAKTHQALPDFDTSWGLVVTTLPSLVFKDVHEKLLIEVVCTVADVTGTKVGVITAYFLPDELQRYLDRKDVILLSNSGFRIGASYSVPVDRVITQKLEKRFKTNLVEIISMKPSRLPINCGLVKRDIVDLLDINVYELKVLIIIAFLEGLVFFFYMRKRYLYNQRLGIKKSLIDDLKFFKSNINNAGIFLKGDFKPENLVQPVDKKIGDMELVLEKSFIDEISSDVRELLVEKNNELSILNEELAALRETKVKYDRLNESFDDSCKVLKKFYNNLDDIIRVTQKSIKRTKKEEEHFAEEASFAKPDLANLEDVIKRRELVLTTLRDLEEESRLLLESIYSAYLKEVPEDLRFIFESIKRRLRFLNLNIGALDGLFTEVDIRGMINMSREYIEVKKENVKLRKENNRARGMEGELEHYRNSVEMLLAGLKEMEESVISSRFIDTTV